MRLLTVVILALVAGCKTNRLSGSAGDLAVAPRLVFPRTLVGYPTHASLEIRNGGRTLRTVTVETQPPFSLTTATFEIPGGSAFLVELTFDPPAPGEIEGTLKISSEDQTLEPTLAGLAVPPPACADRGPCWHQKYDHAAGGCVQINEPDASACNGGTACLLTSQCIAGECVGTVKSCDDQDACTTDACDAATGCVHFSSTARCGASNNPCQAPACDPAVGCTFTDAPDGTSCGPSDCLSANICLVGQCKTVAVTDGAACGSDSPCQARGLCESQACVRPPASDLTAAWTVWVGDGRHLLWDSIADQHGNVYWREAEPDFSTGHLVSVTSAGFKRFEVPIGGAWQMALIEDVLVLRVGAKLEARSVSNGLIKWTREIVDPTAGAISIRTLARGPAKTLYVGITRADKMPMAALLGSSVLSLNLATGATNWEVKLPHQQIDDQSTPVDEAGYLYAGTYGHDGKRRYYGFTPQGQIRWGIENPHSNPAAVFGGRVYHWDHWLSETASGTWVNATPPTLYAAGYPRLALGAVSYVGTETALVPNCAMPGTEQMGTTLQLVRVDPATSQIQWTREIAGKDSGGLDITNTILTSRSAVLFSQPDDYCKTTTRSVLREISAQGEPSFSCRLPGTDAYFGEGLLNDKRWISGIKDTTGKDGVRAIELPGFELPAHGWSTAWGSPARDNHAR